MLRRLLIIGASGFLGEHLARQAASAFEIVRADIVAPDGDGLVMDVTSAASVNAGFQQTAPDVAVLLASVSDIDQCESHPQLAESVNVNGTGNVVEACARTGARLLFTSSAAVFDGTKHGYRECDPPTPVSVYGRTKVRAEELIAMKLPPAIVLRLALVVGFAGRQGTNAMLNKFGEALRAGRTVTFPDYEYRNPMDAVTLSRFIVELLGLPAARGIFHLGATESISRFELGVKLAEGMGFAPDLVKRQTEPLPGRAPRGRDHFLVTERIREICRTPVPSCQQVIERAIHEST